MARDLIKKIVIGGAIILSTALPVLGKDGNPLKQPEKKPIERVVMLSKSAPFVDSKYRLAKKEQDFLIGLEELNYKLEKDGLGKDRVLDYYSKNRVERQGDIINYFTRNPERRAAASKLTYSRYRKLLGLDEKIKSAPDFFEEYQDFLMQASEKYSVPPSIIASIIGVESDFSKNKGKYPAFDALASLYITSKKDFAYRELKELLRFCDTRDRKLDDFISSYAETIGLTPLIHSIYTGLKEFLAFFDTKDQILNELTSSYAGAIGWAPLIHYTYTGLKEFLAFFDTKDQTLNELTSSYAGAIGWAQFIPSSLNRLFIGKNMDFNADPFDMEDCIHSVAYYLNRSGWDPRREKNIYEGSRNWKALLAYNKSSVYVKAVLELSRSLDNYIRSAAASAKPSPEPDF